MCLFVLSGGLILAGYFGGHRMGGYRLLRGAIIVASTYAAVLGSSILITAAWPHLLDYLGVLEAAPILLAAGFLGFVLGGSRGPS